MSFLNGSSINLIRASLRNHIPHKTMWRSQLSDHDLRCPYGEWRLNCGFRTMSFWTIYFETNVATPKLECYDNILIFNVFMLIYRQNNKKNPNLYRIQKIEIVESEYKTSEFSLLTLSKRGYLWYHVKEISENLSVFTLWRLFFITPQQSHNCNSDFVVVRLGIFQTARCQTNCWN